MELLASFNLTTSLGLVGLDFITTVLAMGVNNNKHPDLSAPVGGQMFTGALVTEKHCQIYTGDLELCNKDTRIFDGDCFYVDQISLLGSPVCSQGFICDAFYTGKIRSLSRD